MIGSRSTLAAERLSNARPIITTTGPGNPASASRSGKFGHGRNDPRFVRARRARDRDRRRRRIEPCGDGARRKLAERLDSACRPTVVAAGSARLASRCRPAACRLRPWPVMYCTPPRGLRCVSDTPSRARRALRRGDAGHHLDRDAGLAAGRDLLAGAAEDHRVAALEPHHAAAGLGERRPSAR